MYTFKNSLFAVKRLSHPAKQGWQRLAIALSVAVLAVLPMVTAEAQNRDQEDEAQPVVFQAAGPDVNSIQGTITQFRAALRGDNNGNAVGPLDTGRREINWDGGGNTTTVSPTPLDNFLVNRGARFTTPGTGFVQAPPAGLADVFENPTYANIFKAFSPLRLFSPIGSKVTDTLFFVPGPGAVPATTRGFGAIFTDLDLPDGSGPGAKQGNRHASTLLEFFDVNGELLFSSFAPASPGDGNQSFFGIVFDDARIARVRITTGAVPGPDDSRKLDVVMMDDFIYAEPQAIH